MRAITYFLCLSVVVKLAYPAPTNGFVFPEDGRRQKKLEPIITPPVLPYLEHLERDPSTLLPNETGPGFRHVPQSTPPRRHSSPRFGNGFNVSPNSNGGVTASFSNSAGGGGASQSASQSFSFGFNEGFSASHSASHSASFGSGFGNGFSGSQASSQAASFSGNQASAAASSAAAFGAGGHSGSQSASSAFGFNSPSGFQPSYSEPSFGEGLLDVRHRGAPDFFFPGLTGRSRGAGAATFRSGGHKSSRNGDNFLAVVVSD